MDLSRFNRMDFLPALKALFKDLHVPVNYLADEPTSPQTILKDTWKDNAAFKLMKDVYFLGMVDDAAFSGNKSIDASKIQSDYDGVLIFGVTLSERDNNRLPTRSQLAEIARAFNREYFYTPVIVVFKYGMYLAFANTERLKYKQEWREGEKAGKVSLLRDIDITNRHPGHFRIINDLKIPDSGKNKVDSFATLYAYWQDVFSVSILNKKFYQELSNWYFWAIKEVSFPDSPVSLIHKLDEKEQAMKHEHNAKNVIRLLTRFLFVWFIKEKKLIPEELFDIDYLKNELLKDLSPVHHEGLFKQANIASVYYKAILQNLFFASLNCPIEPSGDGDNRKRGFRLKDNFGQHRDANYLMRYQDQFNNPEKFTELINGIVPFLNGGLFECLDNKTDKIYIDGFSDNLVKPHQLIVPDYLFFGFDQEVDLSGVVGIKTKAFKNARVKGLISILESYKFTVAENTPIEEDVALDPELLGKVFENLLATYNPETKTTARKQTGSFYTPREIVNYMVDESLIAYLKNSVKNWDIEAEELDEQLHDLLSYDALNPFAENNNLQKQIIHTLDNCKILDPACGSGAFPMGILQKMVHILQKVDPENKYWQELQLNKAVKETEGAFAITDKKEREQKLIEINEAFDEKINDPDYARKLFLVEDCIYGVDIQPIATQISKLRFFISLVVDQKVDKAKSNFGIRALPNLETKFVAANTLIGIDKPEVQMTLFDNQEIKELEQELKNVRHRLFSAKSPATKRKLRDKDKEIREKIGGLLVEHGWGNETAKQLAGWDPYDQNASSPFFDPEWMFGIEDGFDVVIGNPPYITYKGKEVVDISDAEVKQLISLYPNSAEYKVNSYALFTENGAKLLKKGGTLSFIIPSTILQNEYLKKIRKYLVTKYHISQIVSFANKVFEAVTDSIILNVINNHSKTLDTIAIRKSDLDFSNLDDLKTYSQKNWDDEPNCYVINLKTTESEDVIISKIELNSEFVDDYLEVYVGIVANGIKKFLSSTKINSNYKKYLQGKHIDNFAIYPDKLFINFIKEELHSNTDEAVYLQKEKILVRKTGNRLIAVIDDEKYFTDQSIYNLYPKRGKTVNLKIITALLNSPMLEYYFNKKMITNPDVFPYIKGIHLKKLPIKFPKDKSLENKIESLFIKIIDGKKDDTDVTKLKQQLNEMVYKLYELTDEEIAIVEGPK